MKDRLVIQADAFGDPGRSGSVENSGQAPWVASIDRERLVLFIAVGRFGVEIKDGHHAALHDGCEQSRPDNGRRREEKRRPGVVQDVNNPIGWEGGIDGKISRARLEDGQQGNDELDAGLQANGDDLVTVQRPRRVYGLN